ncbi:MAG: hypothetical protein ACYDHH_22285 [Solirubrobacteraceae bacterium]
MPVKPAGPQPRHGSASNSTNVPGDAAAAGGFGRSLRQIYAITVIAGLAGAIGTFLSWRRELGAHALGARRGTTD